MPDLSVIILSFNTLKITKNTIRVLVKSLKSSNIKAEIIIVDNNSVDGSVKMLRELVEEEHKDINFKPILNKKNYGFGKANNQGLSIAESRNILFLNSDVLIDDVDWSSLISFFDKNYKIGALTVKVMLQNGKIDPASHRGFPTIWNSFSCFSKLESIFGNVPLFNFVFGGYHLKHKDLETIHEIDSPSGAFFLTRKKLMIDVNGFDDKTFFLYGGDLDLSYRIKDLGYKILYYPKYSVLHLKSVSGLKKKDAKVRTKTKEYFYDAMKKFYSKHYIEKYPKFITNIVYFFIDLKRKSS